MDKTKFRFSIFRAFSIDYRGSDEVTMVSEEALRHTEDFNPNLTAARVGKVPGRYIFFRT